MRSCARLLVALCLPLVLAGCPGSHTPEPDGGLPRGDGGSCGGAPFLICVSDCRGDAGRSPICSGGSWSCPPGTFDLSSCPPSCFGPPPAPGCVCEGTSWSCPPTACPDGIEPWNPDAPGNVCSPDGISCASGGGVCGGGMFCDCVAGRWQCGVAEPDPVCWCGREPSPGDPCTAAGETCGACCPTGSGESWPPYVCVEGTWQPADCPAIVCEPVTGTCPVRTEPLVGRACELDGQSCGDPCCGDAIVCEGGAWQRGPDALCFACLEFPCGDGACNTSQYCRSQCGPADGIEHVCEPLPVGCGDCSCLPLWEWERCDMIDGHPHVTGAGFCG